MIFVENMAAGARCSGSRRLPVPLGIPALQQMPLAFGLTSAGFSLNGNTETGQMAAQISPARGNDMEPNNRFSGQGGTC